MSTTIKPHPNECPFIDRSFIPDENFNTAVEYKNHDGIYVFYRHEDGDGEMSQVQFCKLIGRKKDIFECLNISEWKRCQFCEYEIETTTNADKLGEKS